MAPRGVDLVIGGGCEFDVVVDGAVLIDGERAAIEGDVHIVHQTADDLGRVLRDGCVSKQQVPVEGAAGILNQFPHIAIQGPRTGGAEVGRRNALYDQGVSPVGQRRAAVDPEGHGAGGARNIKLAIMRGRGDADVIVGRQSAAIGQRPRACARPVPALIIRQRGDRRACVDACGSRRDGAAVGHGRGARAQIEPVGQTRSRSGGDRAAVGDGGGGVVALDAIGCARTACRGGDGACRAVGHIGPGSGIKAIGVPAS